MEESQTDTILATELEQRDRLITVLGQLELQIKKQTSLKFVLLRGVIYGLGTVIGATVLVALLGSVLSQFVGENTLAEFITTEVND